MKFSKIRLIPKANKCPKPVSNWRPISLLNHSYKLYSSILNARLEKVTDKIVHKAQKAYTEVAVIQENILQVFETLSKANHISCPLTSLLIDFSKAFDSINHEYILEVLEFFNLGPDMIKYVKILTTRASIARRPMIRAPLNSLTPKTIL